MYLIVDCNAICHQVRHGLKKLDHDDAKTGIIFGFLNQVLLLGQMFHSNKFIFCWDSKTSIRKKHYPEYKAKRHIHLTPEERKELDEAFAQFELLKTDVLYELGFENVFYLDGWEGDDILAYYATTINKKAMVITTDQDLFQIVTDKIKIYSPMAHCIIGEKEIMRRKGCTPLEFTAVKAIAGCSTDGVCGIKGVGEATALKYLNGDLKAGKMYDRIVSAEGQRTIKITRKITQLPNPAFMKQYAALPQEEIQINKDDFTQGIIPPHWKRMKSVFSKYGMESFLYRKDEWVEFLKGTL